LIRRVTEYECINAALSAKIAVLEEQAQL
jgi:hypothetical protein